MLTLEQAQYDFVLMVEDLLVGFYSVFNGSNS